MTKAKYDLYLNLPTMGVVQAAEVIIFESPRKQFAIRGTVTLIPLNTSRSLS